MLRLLRFGFIGGVFFIFLGFYNNLLWAANIYVDAGSPESGTLWDGTDGNSYTGSPGVGTGYSTVQAAVDAMSAGDTLYMRGGTYSFSGSGLSLYKKYGTSWNEGGYYKMCSYPGEWAILDGERSTTHGIVIHAGFPAYGSGYTSSYWWFERFEVTGGGATSVEATCSGIWLNGGPFKFRYLYIHDNLSWTYTDNAAGLSGVYMKDSVIEYCYFSNNGTTGAANDNCSNITFYSVDPDKILTATNGYPPRVEEEYRGLGTINNIVRYNYFSGGGGSSGVKNKIDQYFIGRNSDAGHGWDDTYKDYGNRTHHNIFNDLSGHALFIAQDFAQVYQNIIIGGGTPSICVQYAPGIPQFYKAVIYNNTIIDPKHIAIVRYGSWTYRRFEFDQSSTRAHYGWDYNNLIQGGSGYSPWSDEEIISVIPDANSAQQFDFSNYIGSNNYFYNPGSTDVYRLGNISYTPSEYNAQTRTNSQKVIYSTSGDSPFIGTSGADKLRTTGSFVIDGAITIANGGKGGDHPYLSGVSIPSYIGATNPEDNAWVSGVLGLNANYMTSAEAGSIPSWTEGTSSDGSQSPPNKVQDFKTVVVP